MKVIKKLTQRKIDDAVRKITKVWKFTDYLGEKHEMPYVLIGDVPEKYRNKFATWMVGQTRPVIECEPLGSQACYYAWDYKRFLEKELTGFEVFD